MNTSLKEISIGGRLFRVDDLDSLGLASGVDFERTEIDFVEGWVKPGDVCVDVGANIGLFTVTMARCAGVGGRIYAFEPDPTNFALLEDNASLWRDASDIRLNRVACGDVKKTSALYKSNENLGMHRLYESVCCQGGSIEVDTVLIDDYVSQPVNLIKVDIEGYEPFALKGMVQTIRRSPAMALLTEFSPLSMLEAGGRASELLMLLSELGLHAHRLDQGGLIRIDVARLVDACLKLEAGNFAEFRSLCRGLDAADILSAASKYANDRGYTEPILENFVFLRDSR